MAANSVVVCDYINLALFESSLSIQFMIPVIYGVWLTLENFETLAISNSFMHV